MAFVGVLMVRGNPPKDNIVSAMTTTGGCWRRGAADDRGWRQGSRRRAVSRRLPGTGRPQLAGLIMPQRSDLMGLPDSRAQLGGSKK